MEPGMLGRGAVVFAVLLGALGMVTWRQSRALESLAVLDDLHRQVSVASAERAEQASANRGDQPAPVHQTASPPSRAFAVRTTGLNVLAMMESP